MNYVVYNRKTKHVYGVYPTAGGANAAVTRAQNRVGDGKTARIAGTVVRACYVEDLDVATAGDFRKNIDKMVTVRSLMTGAEVQLRESEVGGPCDPSTERYWSM
jgi:hypothetical protein